MVIIFATILEPSINKLNAFLFATLTEVRFTVYPSG